MFNERGFGYILQNIFKTAMCFLKIKEAIQFNETVG